MYAYVLLIADCMLQNKSNENITIGTKDGCTTSWILQATQNIKYVGRLTKRKIIVQQFFLDIQYEFIFFYLSVYHVNLPHKNTKYSLAFFFSFVHPSDIPDKETINAMAKANI